MKKKMLLVVMLAFGALLISSNCLAKSIHDDQELGAYRVFVVNHSKHGIEIKIRFSDGDKYLYHKKLWTKKQTLKANPEKKFKDAVRPLWLNNPPHVLSLDLRLGEYVIEIKSAESEEWKSFTVNLSKELHDSLPGPVTLDIED